MESLESDSCKTGYQQQDANINLRGEKQVIHHIPCELENSKIHSIATPV